MSKDIAKTYKHNTATLAVINVVIDGENIEVKFQHGRISPSRVNGFFTTSDKVLQAAIEKHSHYKTKFILEKVNGVLLEEEADVKIVSAVERKLSLLQDKYDSLVKDFNDKSAELERTILKLSKKKNEPKAAAKPIPDAKESVIEVKNLQEAKEILKAEPYNIPAVKMPNPKAIENRAKELNVTIKLV